jgi:hypothetical protein
MLSPHTCITRSAESKTRRFEVHSRSPNMNSKSLESHAQERNVVHNRSTIPTGQANLPAMNTINPPSLTSIPPIPPLPNPISTHIIKLNKAVLLRNPLRRRARPCNFDRNRGLARSSACEVARHNLPLHRLLAPKSRVFQLRCARGRVLFLSYQVLVAAKLVDGV